MGSICGTLRHYFPRLLSPLRCGAAWMWVSPGADFFSLSASFMALDAGAARRMNDADTG